MTPANQVADASPHWHPALAGIRLLLVDFDGPLVRLLPDPEHLELAHRLAAWAEQRTGHPLPGAGDDHVSVLRQINAAHPELAPDAEHIATMAELEAADRHDAYPDAIEVLRRWTADGGAVAIVSNNAERAVARVLTRAGVGDAAAVGVAGTATAGVGGTTTAGVGGGAARVPASVHARRTDRLDALKPRPDLLCDALSRHACVPAQAVMIGDTTTDLRAADSAGVAAIAVAETPARAADLNRPAADHPLPAAVITRLADLIEPSPSA